jgi:nucleoside phosphorylase
MEGSGLVSVAQRLKTPWILIKGITDWGMNKSPNSGGEHQEAIANRVFRFVFDTLQEVGL